MAKNNPQANKVTRPAVIDWGSNNNSNEMSFEDKAKYNHSIRKYEEDVYPRVYKNLLEYMYNEVGASLERNVCALAVDLARANGMTMARLFETYEG